MLRSIGRWIAARLTGRPDKEHEITLNRLVIALVVSAYLFLLLPDEPSLFLARALCSGFTLGAVLLLLHLVARPGTSVVRRCCGMLLDLGVLTAGMAVAAPVIAALYPFYLWVILGYGFRYGLRYLFTAAGLSLVLFGGIVHTTDYWQSNYPLGLGLLAGLVVLPLYAASLVRKLSLARDQAEKANQAKSLFLASVSHELRTPLSAVTGMSDLLRNTGLTTEQTDMVRTIRVSTGRLLSLIDDLLNVSRIDAGQIEFQPVLIDPVAVMRDTLRLVAPQAAEKGLRLNLHVTPRTARAVMADRRRLGEITLNLLSNAVKFTRKGGVTLSLDVEEQPLSALLRVEVDDTGIGIDPAAHERIFETFTQANNTIANDFGGTGLGLAISRRLVRLQGGEIGVCSRPGEGSTFWFTLPVTPGPPLAAAPEMPRFRIAAQGVAPDILTRMELALGPSGGEIVREDVAPGVLPVALPPAQVVGRIMVRPAEGRERPMLLVRQHLEGGLPPAALRSGAFAVLSLERLHRDLPAALSALHMSLQPANDDEATPILRRRQGRRILLVDDNRVNLMVISRLLEAGGHHVTQASQGEEALDQLERATFDLVAMDLNMPVMDGIEATKIYRMISLDRPRLPIIALTADATEYARLRALDAGMDACVTKPIDAVALLDLIDTLLDGKAAVPPPPRAAVPRIVPPTPAEAAPPSKPVLNHRMLEDLVTLGGAEFMREVITSFIADSAQHLEDLRHEVEHMNAGQFRDKLHALRSCASNVGAVALSERCGIWQSADRTLLETKGPEMLEQLDGETQAAKAALLRWQASGPVLVSRNN
jgi:two-component system sensor histidine kinase RpfC